MGDSYVDCTEFGMGCCGGEVVNDLEAFLQWCKLKGHYAAVEAVQRYRQIQEPLKDEET